MIGKHGSATNVSQSFDDLGRAHVVPIVGLYPNYDNEIRVQVLNAFGTLRSDTIVHCLTGDLPASMPKSIDVVNRDDNAPEPGLNLISNYSAEKPQIPLMVDQYGDIRWLLNYENHFALKGLVYDDGIARLRNGNFFFGDISSDRIWEVDVLGKVINSWELNGYTFHHEVFEKPDGNFLISVTKAGSTHPDGSATIEDYIIEVNRSSGAVVNEWDLKESLDENRMTLTSNRQDWVHVNALCYDPSDNTIIISGRVQGVVKLSYDNRVVWIMGVHRGWGRNRRGEDLSQYLLQPIDASAKPITDSLILDGTNNHPDFEWNWCQHSTNLMPNGDLMLFDNGDQRNFNPSPTTWYSRAVQYHIDKQKRTVQQIWAYGKERGNETFSRIVSSARYLPESNHVLFSPGYQVPTGKGFGGRLVEIDYTTKRVVFELSSTNDAKFGWHRVYRLNNYAP